MSNHAVEAIHRESTSGGSVPAFTFRECVPHKCNAALAQLVEQLTSNEQVVSSNLTGGSSQHYKDYKSSNQCGCRGVWSPRHPVKMEIAGSNPVFRAATRHASRVVEVGGAG